jgi:hypothetical protein
MNGLSPFPFRFKGMNSVSAQSLITAGGIKEETRSSATMDLVSRLLLTISPTDILGCNSNGLFVAVAERELQWTKGLANRAYTMNDSTLKCITSKRCRHNLTSTPSTNIWNSQIVWGIPDTTASVDRSSGIQTFNRIIFSSQNLWTLLGSSIGSMQLFYRYVWLPVYQRISRTTETPPTQFSEESTRDVMDLRS